MSTATAEEEVREGRLKTLNAAEELINGLDFLACPAPSSGWCAKCDLLARVLRRINDEQDAITASRIPIVELKETRRVGYTVWYVFSRPDKISFCVAMTHAWTVNSVSNSPTIPELQAALERLKTEKPDA